MISYISIDLSKDADPKTWNLTPEGVAHALARTCRYAGNTREHYSTAEHSWLLASWVLHAAPQRDLGKGRRRKKVALEVLVHDAVEALIGDISWPTLKLLGYDAYKERTEHLEPLLRKELGLVPKPSKELQELVHHFDRCIVGDEICSPLLFPDTAEADGQATFGWSRLHVTVNAWPYATARDKWLELWYRLTTKR